LDTELLKSFFSSCKKYTRTRCEQNAKFRVCISDRQQDESYLK
jgi:hypothetical protein